MKNGLQSLVLHRVEHSGAFLCSSVILLAYFLSCNLLFICFMNINFYPLFPRLAIARCKKILTHLFVQGKQEIKNSTEKIPAIDAENWNCKLPMYLVVSL